MKEQYPGIDCDFSVKDDVLAGIHIQDPEMKSIFHRFRAALLSDSTYKTNYVNMALYVLIAVDGLSKSHVIAAFLQSTEDEASLTHMMIKFKETNPEWENDRALYLQG